MATNCCNDARTSRICMLLKPFLILCLLTILTAITALFLWHVERDEESLRIVEADYEKAKKRLDFAVNVTAKIFNNSRFVIYVDEERSLRIIEILDEALLQFQIISQLDDSIPSATNLDPEMSRWTPWRSIIYCLSLITTVGHQGVHPLTLWGRIVATGFTLVSLPLFLWLVVAVATLLERCLDLYVNQCCGEPMPTSSDVTNLQTRAAIGQANDHRLGTSKMCIGIFLSTFWYAVVCLGLYLWKSDLSVVDTLYTATLSLCTVQIPLDVLTDEYIIVAISAAILIMLVLLALTARFSARIERYESCINIEERLMEKERSGTFSDYISRFKDKIHPAAPPELMVKRKHMQLDHEGKSTLIEFIEPYSYTASPASGQRRPWPYTPSTIGDDERIWVAEIGKYAELPSPNTQRELDETQYLHSTNLSYKPYTAAVIRNQIAKERFLNNAEMLRC